MFLKGFEFSSLTLQVSVIRFVYVNSVNSVNDRERLIGIAVLLKNKISRRN